MEETRKFFREAKAYHGESKHTATNLKFEAVKGLFDQSKSFFVHCDLVKEMMMAIDLAKEFGFKLVVVGGSDSWIIADILKENKVAVILSAPHSLPATDDDDVTNLTKQVPYFKRQEYYLLFVMMEEAVIGSNETFLSRLALWPLMV